jgi:GT2 family glycosyltransferase
VTNVEWPLEQRLRDGGSGSATQALVLTHNAPASLGRCAAAIAAQTTPPEEILVVDNASDPPIDSTSIDVGIPLRVVRSNINLGPAGGWAMAFSEFLEGPYDYAWVMDDDMIPQPDCLASVWAEAKRHEEPPFVFPLAEQPDGSIQPWGSWCGFLIGKDIVKQVGVPNADLFWWAEDTEYNHWRIPKAGHPRRIADGALVRHDAIRQTEGIPTWKYYYETRNMIYLHLHVMRRVGWFPKNFTRLMGRALLREKTGRAERFKAILRGVRDGLTGRLGVLYPITPMQEMEGK